MNEQVNEIVNIVAKSFEFNKQNQRGQGLKILTPNQSLSRLPTSLASLTAGNNTEKLKNGNLNQATIIFFVQFIKL